MQICLGYDSLTGEGGENPRLSRWWTPSPFGAIWGIRIRQYIESHRFQLLLYPPLWELKLPRIARGFLQTVACTARRSRGTHAVPKLGLLVCKPPALPSPEPRAHVWDGSLNLAFNPKSVLLCFGEVSRLRFSKASLLLSQAQRSGCLEE